MLKAPRYMREYASDTKKKIMADAGWNAEQKKRKCEYIDKLIRSYQQGLIQDWEVMGVIADMNRII